MDYNVFGFAYKAIKVTFTYTLFILLTINRNYKFIFLSKNKFKKFDIVQQTLYYIFLTIIYYYLLNFQLIYIYISF